ncbi:short chain dehydrogenase [Xylaria intraflava]|nr:short chain dehydrogenase [Xylaria intraflava]
MPNPRHAVGALAALAAIFALRRILRAQRSRRREVRPDEERVLILGASSGLGRTLAKQYAARGAFVCAVARRSEPLAQLAKECGDRCLPFVADFTEPTDMARLRDEMQQQWDGLDTLHVCAGVSAVQPVMALTGIESSHEDPAILLVSSIAAVVPAPTRALYAASKAASLLFFQSLAIEHPDVAFTCVLPATIEGNFRASAVDADPRQRPDGVNEGGLKLDYVAGKCTDAVDRGLRGNVVIPWIPYAIAHHLYYIWPSLIEGKARKKYNFTV